MASPHQTLWVRGAITYAVYVAAGVLSLLVATADHHVSQLYIAAGLGLAFVLGWGRAMVWPVGLGSGTITLISHAFLDPGPLPPQMAAVIAASAFGGGLQAWVAARCLQGPDERRPMALDTVTEAVRFLLVAGPVSCVINATLAISTMALVGILPSSHWLTALGSWWAGDALGVLMGTPMLLTLVGRPGRLWRQRRLVVGLPLLVATLLLGVGIRQVQVWEDLRESSEFRQQTEATANGVRLRLNGYLAAIEGIRGVYDASDTVERDEFRRATAHWITHLQGVLAIGWEERLHIDRLPEFEAAQRAEGVLHYTVYDLPGHTRPRGPDILAVRFVEPREGHEALLGLNVLSRDVSRLTYERAVRENAPEVTPGFVMPGEADAGQPLGVVIYRAVYRTPPLSKPIDPASSMGSIFVVLHMDDAMAEIIKDMPSHMGACLVDISSTPVTYLGGDARCKNGEGPSARFSTTVPLPFAGKTWALRLWALNAAPLVGSANTYWLFAVGGVVFAATLAILLLVVTGTTEHMAAAVDEAREQRAAAESANQAKSEFLSRMSHELRTPLNAILGFAQVMSIDSLNPLNSTQQSRLDQVQQAGWHLLDMIDDVLDLSRIDAGTLTLRSERLSLPDVLEAARSMVQAMAQRLDITLNIDAQLPSSWGVLADDTRLRQVLTNLLSNAVKYNKLGGRVNVTASLLRGDGDPRVQVVVQDTGLGMNPEQLGQLFQPFNRLGRERLSPDGTGIGLVISRHLVQLMGGTLEVASQEGEGSVFTLTLPAAVLQPVVAEAPRPPANLAPPPKPDQPVKHVLYVEDNDANTAVVQAALLGRPWIHLSVVATIEAGLAALHDRLRGPLPDLILLDVHLPDASGLDFLKLVKANPDTALIPVIMISADAMPEQIDTCLKAGAACYLTKPLQIAALLQQTDDLLNLAPVGA